MNVNLKYQAFPYIDHYLHLPVVLAIQVPMVAYIGFH